MRKISFCVIICLLFVVPFVFAGTALNQADSPQPYPYQVKVAYSGTNAEYVGKALPGTATNAPKWQIMKLTYDANDNVTDVKYANGTNTFTLIWDSRATYSY